MTCHFYGENFKIPHLKEIKILKQYFGGDIQKFLGKLPGFIWAKYKGEKHLPHYNYLGPGTRLDIRLDENNNPKAGEEPINAIDRLAYMHDLAYQKSDNIEDRHRADQEMINGLKQLTNLSLKEKLIKAMVIKLFQAKIKLGQGTRAAKTQAIQNLFKTDKQKFTEKLDDVKELGDRQRIANELGERQRVANELHKPFRKPKQLRKIYFRSKDNIWNADLVIMPPENNHKYILTILDGYTRYAWCIPLKTKKGEEVAEAFKSIIKKSNRKPNKLWVDQGKEFYNEHMYKLFKFKKNDILEKDENGEYKNKIYSVFNASKNPVIERFNRTLTNQLWKQFTIQGNQKWLKILPEIVNKYNNTIHKTIGTTPALASTNPSLVKVNLSNEKLAKDKQSFKVGDRVRIFKYKNKFEKGYKGYWTKEIFRVKEILKTNPTMYKIEDLNDENVHGSFYANELQRTYF